jgi:hypothetical protein
MGGGMILREWGEMKVAEVGEVKEDSDDVSGRRTESVVASRGAGSDAGGVWPAGIDRSSGRSAEGVPRAGEEGPFRVRIWESLRSPFRSLQPSGIWGMSYRQLQRMAIYFGWIAAGADELTASTM